VAQYQLLYSGAALGKGVGPLLVSKRKVEIAEVANCSIAIPGENTTANFLLSYAFPSAHNREPMLFSAIEDAVCQGSVDLGVIIHENRFTYQQKGLQPVCDLGEIWESREAMPLPLAGIAIKKALPQAVKEKVNGLICRSVQHSFERYPELSGFITQHAQAMDETVMRNHIQLYVNEYSVDLGEQGKAAILKFHEVYNNIKKITATGDNLFI
jgi:1,4-dihydroxy-6-naphthoate synthase